MIFTMRNLRKPSPDGLWADDLAFTLALWEWTMATILDAFISAFQKLSTDDVSLEAEIAALQGQEQAFEANVNAQATAAVAAALNTAGISASALQALTDRVTALEAADSALNTAATPPTLSSGVSTSLSTVSTGVSTSLSTISTGVSTSLSSGVSTGVSTSLSTLST